MCWPNACECPSEPIINRLFAETTACRPELRRSSVGASSSYINNRKSHKFTVMFSSVGIGGEQMSLALDLHPGTRITSLKHSQCCVYKQHLLHLMDGCSLSLVPANSPTRFIISATHSSPKHARGRTHRHSNYCSKPSVFLYWPSLLCGWALTVLRFHSI